MLQMAFLLFVCYKFGKIASSHTTLGLEQKSWNVWGLLSFEIQISNTQGMQAGAEFENQFVNPISYGKKAKHGELDCWLTDWLNGRLPDCPSTCELQNPSHYAPELNKSRWCIDCEALTLWKSRSGGWLGIYICLFDAMPADQANI